MHTKTLFGSLVPENTERALVNAVFALTRLVLSASTDLTFAVSASVKSLLPSVSSRTGERSFDSVITRIYMILLHYCLYAA